MINCGSLPDKIFAVEYGGFFDFNESGMYEDASLLDRDSYPDAEVISNEISNRYNNFKKMKEALETCKTLLDAFNYGTNAPPARTAFINDLEQLLESLK